MELMQLSVKSVALHVKVLLATQEATAGLFVGGLITGIVLVAIPVAIVW